jgi:hypothetical protein
MQHFSKITDETELYRLLGAVHSASADFLAGTMGLTETVRCLTSLSHQLGIENDPEFLTIRGIESETDNFPLGKHRDPWPLEPLQRFDAEREKVEQFYKPAVTEAIHHLLMKYPGRPNPPLNSDPIAAR